jgi:hypothetical protein
MGGYFAPYVAFNLVLFMGLLYKSQAKEKLLTLSFVLLLSLITAFVPQAYNLRYCSYWIICLISTNLHLLFTEQIFIRLKLVLIKLLFAGFLISVISLTKAAYAFPRFITLDNVIATSVNPMVLQQIKEGDEVCLIGFQPNTFLYSSFFYPGKNYLVKAESQIWGRVLCQTRRAIQSEK